MIKPPVWITSSTQAQNRAETAAVLASNPTPDNTGADLGCTHSTSLTISTLPAPLRLLQPPPDPTCSNLCIKKENTINFLKKKKGFYWSRTILFILF